MTKQMIPCQLLKPFHASAMVGGKLSGSVMHYGDDPLWLEDLLTLLVRRYSVRQSAASSSPLSPSLPTAFSMGVIPNLTTLIFLLKDLRLGST